MGCLSSLTSSALPPKTMLPPPRPSRSLMREAARRRGSSSSRRRRCRSACRRAAGRRATGTCPKPPRSTVSPLPSTSQAKPTRGWKTKRRAHALERDVRVARVPDARPGKACRPPPSRRSCDSSQTAMPLPSRSVQGSKTEKRAPKLSVRPGLAFQVSCDERLQAVPGDVVERVLGLLAVLGADLSGQQVGEGVAACVLPPQLAKNMRPLLSPLPGWLLVMCSQ